MDRDEWANLGLNNLKEDREAAKAAETPASDTPKTNGLRSEKS